MKIPFISIFMMTEQLKLELNANIKIIITLISIFNELDNWNYRIKSNVIPYDLHNIHCEPYFVFIHVQPKAKCF